MTTSAVAAPTGTIVHCAPEGSTTVQHDIPIPHAPEGNTLVTVDPESQRHTIAEDTPDNDAVPVHNPRHQGQCSHIVTHTFIRFSSPLVSLSPLNATSTAPLINPGLMTNWDSEATFVASMPGYHLHQRAPTMFTLHVTPAV
ncbi:hypothetical protein H4R20_006450, partial [Coemansia guatemalensis]